MYIRGLGNFFNELFLPEASVHWNCLQNRVKLDKSLNSACACIRKDLKLSETSHLYSLNNAVSVSWVFFFKDKHWNWNKIFKNYQQEIFQWNHVVGFLEWWWKMDFLSWFKTGQEFKSKKKKFMRQQSHFFSLFNICPAPAEWETRHLCHPTCWAAVLRWRVTKIFTDPRRSVVGGGSKLL